jgi:conjugal transfer mating pair stabilization protein TraN
MCIAQEATVSGSTEKVYTCPSGGTLQGTNCVVTSTPYAATGTNIYYCNQTLYGTTTLSGSTCYVPLVNGAGYYTGTTYTCPTTGHTLSGSNCTIAILGSFTDVYSCPSTRDLAGAYCYSKTYPYALTGSATLVSHTQNYSTVAATATQSGWTVPVVQAASTYSAPYSTTYSCPSTATISGSTCNPTPTNYVASFTWTGFCPVHYSVNTSTGACNAVAFVPNAIVGPVVASYVCSSYNTDGTYQNFLSPHDITYASYDGLIICGLSAYTPADVESTYICQETNSANGDLIWYISDGDKTGSTSTISVHCSYQGVPTEENLEQFETFINPNTNVILCATENFDAWVICNIEAF